MAMITKYGTIFGDYLKPAGRMFFVGPASSTVSTVTVDGRAYPMSDGNDGLSPERPLATIAQAISNATANVGDTIMLFPGTHNLTSQTGSTAAAALAFSKAGITVIGLPFDPVRSAFSLAPQAIITAPASTVAAVCTAADLTFLNCSFLGVSGAASLSFTTACSRLTVRGCYFDLTVGAASTGGIIATSATQAPANVLIEDSLFAFDNTGTSGSFGLNIGAAIHYLVRNNHFRLNAKGAGVVAHTTAVQVNDVANGLFDGNYFYSSLGSAAAITNGILGVAMAGTAAIRFWHNKVLGVSVTNPFTGFAASDADLLLNYVGTVAGGTGGTLITSTT